MSSAGQPSSSSLSATLNAQSARAMPPPAQPPKRKIDAVAGNSRISRPSINYSQMPTASQGDIINIDDDESQDNAREEDVNELYCMLRTTIVGIQYYKGWHREANIRAYTHV
jgi:SWI/SNF-related matrix-associated actin-dependent regulator of chromatin subfamily A3